MIHCGKEYNTFTQGTVVEQRNLQGRKDQGRAPRRRIT